MKSINLYLMLFFCFIAGRSVCVYSQELSQEEIEQAFAEIDFNTIYYPDQARQQFDSIRGILTTKQQDDYLGYIDLIKAQLLFKDLEVDSALVSVEAAISKLAESENKMWLSRCQYLLGRLAEATGLFEQAKINYYETITLSDRYRGYWIGFAYVGLARCKRGLGEIYEDDLAIGISILEEGKDLKVLLYAKFMQQLFGLERPEAPRRLNEIAIDYIGIGLLDRAANVYKVVASSYFSHGNIDSAHVYCDKAIDLIEYNDIGKLILPALYQFKGLLYFNEAQYNISDVYFSKSLTLYEANNQSNRMMYTYNYLHQIDVAKGNFKKAYQNLQKYNDLVERTTSSEKVRMAKVLEINNMVALMRGQLVQLKTEKKASEFMLYLVLVITMVVLAGVGVYIYLYQKSKKAKIEELNKEFHNLLIGIGEKQLLEHRLSNSQNLTKRDKKELAPIDGLNSSSEKSDGNIGDSFDSCYMETINLFTDSFPQLTKTEVRYSVMICLRLPIEVIAKVQNVQPASIRKAKQRIRTKLEVNDSLEDYLQEFRERQISSLAV